MPHLMVAPILLPMLAAAVMILLAEHRRPLKLVHRRGVRRCSAWLISLALLVWVNAQGPVAYLPATGPCRSGSRWRSTACRRRCCC